MREFPPRLPHLPIFYPVTNVEYATQIARDWNTKDGSLAGYVTEFTVDDSFLSAFEPHTVGSSLCMWKTGFLPDGSSISTLPSKAQSESVPHTSDRASKYSFPTKAYSKPNLEPTVYEHTSTSEFLERLFGLPTLASVNHLFDTATPVGGNYEAAPSGATAGPPAPPRDAGARIGDLFECFDF
jgi:hypothetical protein